MTALLTLDAAKQHLRVDFPDDDEDIQRKIDAASEIVLDYIKRRGPRPDEANPTPPDWTSDDVPSPIAAAVAIVLSKLYDDRAAGKEDVENVALGYLTPSVTAILHRLRDPAIA